MTVVDPGISLPPRHDQVEDPGSGLVRMTLSHYPMLTWNGQHQASVAEPNIHLYGHVHALYQKDPEISPLKDAAAWPALDVGFDGNEYQVWSLDEILEHVRPRLEAFETLKIQSRQFDPFRGRGHRGCGPRVEPEMKIDVPRRFPRIFQVERRRPGAARRQP